MTKGILIKLNKVIGFFYPAENADIAVINLAGAPGFGDNGNSKTGKTCNSYGVSYINPDYIGMCRSDGRFSFKGCVETIYECIDFLKGKSRGLDIKQNKLLPKLKYKRIILFGTSFGGSIAPFVDKYKKTEISDLFLICPVTNWNTQNSSNGAEPIDEFINILTIGMKNVWRGLAKSEMPKVFKGEVPELNPINSTELLKGKNVYIFHGTRDKSISYIDSMQYFQKVKSENLAKNVYFEALKNFGHTSSAVQSGVTKALQIIVKKT